MPKRNLDFDDLSVTKKQSVELAFLPHANPSYFQSFAHDSTITCVASCKSVVVTGTKTGGIAFWKEENGSLTFVKQYIAHRNKAVVQVTFSEDGERMGSLGAGDNSIKIFDITTFDMIQVIDCKIAPSIICWCSYEKAERIIFTEGKDIHIVDPNGDEQEEPRDLIPSIHRFPITCLAYNVKYGFLISVDSKGFIEYSVPGGNFQLPSSNVTKFQLKTETQLFDLTKNKVSCNKLIYSETFDKFATVSDDGIRVWDVLTGKIIKKYNEGIHIKGSVAFEPSGQYIICTSNEEDGGIKVISIDSGSVVCNYGQLDAKTYNYLFKEFCLLNNSDISDFTIDMISSENTLLQSKLQRNPILVCGAENSNKLFIFQNSPDVPDKSSNGDVPELGRDRSIQVNKTSILKERRKGILSQHDRITIHTTLGDITVKLFNDQTPKTVENFLTLCARHYYDHIIFHRVIKKFMLQTGDPLGDGTGGESAWGGHFKDEFNPILNHNKPFMLSMANAGANTNGSQFFITTEPAPWLDGKHTVFGEVIEGKDVVKAIESVETDKNDKPLDQVVILSTTQHEIE